MMFEIDFKKNGKKKHKYFSKKIIRHGVGFADFDINDSKSSLTFSCTLLLSLSHLFCGIVIPLSDSFVTTSRREAGTFYYLEIFLVLQYSIATIGVFYIQMYIYIIEKGIKFKKTNIEAKDSECNNDDDIKKSLDTLTDAENTKVKFNLTQPLPNESENTNCHFQPNEELNQISVTSCQSILSRGFSNMSDTSSINSHNLETNAIVKDNEGINLYLRLGAVAFGFGVMVHDGFKIADQFRLQKPECHNDLWTPKHCLHLAYIFFQTFFIFKYHKMIFWKQKSLLRFILCQLSVINICQWFKSVVFEINAELLEHEMTTNVLSSHFNNSYYNFTCVGQLSQSVSPYLFPCAIEYGLICAAIFYKMLQKVGRSYKEKLTLHYPNVSIDQFSGCHRSHKGLFVGLLFFMATLVGLATFLTFKRKSSTKNLAVMVYQISEIILLVSSVIALTCAFIKMKVLKFRQLREEEALDNNLILIGLAGVFAYNLFLFISTIDSSIKSKTEKLDFSLILFICKALTEIIQSVIQVLFILEGSRKCAGCDIDVSIKPGRSYLTFLIITNLALWIVSIFEAKRAEEHLLFTNYYQKTPWSIIIHTLLPLIIFFRFHSTVCLSDIWTNSFKMKTTKIRN